MAAAFVQPLKSHSVADAAVNFTDTKPLKVCFSYAAYAKNLIHRLLSSKIPVEVGLSDAEFAAVESSFHVKFPPDLRSILREGLPIGPEFPNWRSSSKQQLDILINLPILEICREVSRKEFWIDSWGDKPDDGDKCVNIAKGFLKKAPVLVPIYRHFYIPGTPCVAGNPVFYVHDGVVKLWSFDIAGFFQQIEFTMRGNSDKVLRRPRLSDLLTAPAWAATEARRIELWSELGERVGNVATRGETGRSWSRELGGCLEAVCSRLREGGWKEEDVREMMMMDGCNDRTKCDDHHDENYEEYQGRMRRRVRLLSRRLLRGGWSVEDVAESFGFPEDYYRNGTAEEDESGFDQATHEYMTS
ncbi:hypothetical protein F511_01917 [Dorcoceras hygrometricum]|uniref:Knr4/Smi1-like domain-containing protein n=1 Tax=Dorcoceras hygrometricum TaxID=472368 RepID=A0A2Z7B0A5_9LAMI|nr:hypothetical protein F511_01917 [Dorcoceras hygrometricum]